MDEEEEIILPKLNPHMFKSYILSPKKEHFVLLRNKRIFRTIVSLSCCFCIESHHRCQFILLSSHYCVSSLHFMLRVYVCCWYSACIVPQSLVSDCMPGGGEMDRRPIVEAQCGFSLSLRSAPLHVLRGGGAESENYCPGFAENSRKRKR